MCLLRQSLRAFTAGAAACCAAYTLAAPADIRIPIDNFTFKPDVVTVPVGTRIVWQNDDDIPHSVVETQEQAPLPRPRHRRQVRLHLRGRQRLSIPLRAASPHEGQGDCHTMTDADRRRVRLGAAASAWLAAGHRGIRVHPICLR